VQARLEEAAQCLLVIIGATPFRDPRCMNGVALKFLPEES